ncbi:MAG: NAD(P)/FAD-dependent oxidoreductase, partial [Caldilinea sp.]
MHKSKPIPSQYADVSFWLATAPAYQPSAPLQGTVEVDVAIVGGGFTGLSTAYHLLRADPGLKVAVLEREIVGYGASGRNGSFAMTLMGLGIDVMALLKGKQA